MVVGYVLVGGFAGLIAALVALVLGTSFWTAFGLYVLVGSAAMVLLAAIQMAARAYSDRFSTLRHDETGNDHLSERDCQLVFAIFERGETSACQAVISAA
ncbi:hypothetical protein RA2_04547 [Roseovarius sp. A-2]|uniref:hypothetical protein n=1 Tax=Roseovarius sp. A-2 TaxID=1570360 RepID=UPI0009D2E0ED|nr:hypothetical protein [Roseovarius sp. A-2]GAW37464.1 hypothetical protein RA2_04547 [Roseovarius sp. A-2]